MADGESKGERLDRELMELLQELRVVITGVQVLLAFLLTAPFQQRFAQLQGSLRNAFFAAIACATLSTAFLLAPTAQHRLRWRARDKERLLRTGNQMAIAGTLFLAAAIVLAVYVVTNVLFTTDLALLTAIVFVVVFAVLWYVLPMTWRSPSSDSPSSEEEPADEEEEAGSPDGQAQESRGASSRR
jgi:Kef-type K+ transport system membrane component KefB